MVRLHGETRMRRGHALKSAISVCFLVGALVGVTLHDADHAFGEGDAPCAVCLHAERLDGTAPTAPSIPGTHYPDAIVDIRQAAVAVPARIVQDYRPRAPPSTG